MTRSEQVLEIAKEILSIESKLIELKGKLTELVDGSVDVTEVATFVSPEMNSLSAATQVKNLLKKYGSRGIALSDMYTALPSLAQATVRSYANRFGENLAHGVYRWPNEQ